VLFIIELLQIVVLAMPLHLVCDGATMCTLHNPSTEYPSKVTAPVYTPEMHHYTHICHAIESLQFIPMTTIPLKEREWSAEFKMPPRTVST
jgi:hypothetical protein